MLPSLLVMMKSATRLRMDYEYHLRLLDTYYWFSALYANWRLKQYPRSPLPQAIDLMHHDEVHNAVNKIEDAGTLQKIIALLPAWVAEWRSECAKQLVRRFAYEKHANPNTTDSEFLNLASTVFVCSCCNSADLHYPEVLSHACLYERLEDEDLERYTHGCDERAHIAKLVARHEKWSCYNLTMILARTWAVRIIVACGKDPTCTTSGEMDALDVRLICKNCTVVEDCNVDSRKIMTWRAAVRISLRSSHATHVR